MWPFKAKLKLGSLKPGEYFPRWVGTNPTYKRKVQLAFEVSDQALEFLSMAGTYFGTIHHIKTMQRCFAIAKIMIEEARSDGSITVVGQGKPVVINLKG